MNTRHSVANNENRFSLIVATLVASVKPKNEKRQIIAANGSIIVGYARAENGARSLCLKALCTREVSDNSDSR